MMLIARKQVVREMSEDSFSVKQLGIKIAELLRARENDTIRILRNKMDADRLLVQVIRDSSDQEVVT